MIQKYLITAFLFQVSSSWAFTSTGTNKVPTAFTARSTSTTTTPIATPTSLFMADYNPSRYESMNKPSYNDNYGGGRDSDRSSGGGYGGRSSYERGGGGRGGGGYNSRGGGRGNYEYTRDTSRDNSSVDERTIMNLLDQRSQAKRSRDFGTADAIRDDLLQNHSVGVDDRERSWSTGRSPSSGMRFGGGGGGRGGGRRQRDLGPNGHDYIVSSDAGPSTSPLGESEIHSMIAERLQAKMNRDFQTADVIQIDLINNGVFVNDGMKEWRSDGIAFADMGGGRDSNRNKPYAKSVYSADVEGMHEDTVNKLVGERFKYKIMRDYDKADSIREGLSTKYNVVIDDKLREWSVNGDFGEEHNLQREMADKFAKRDYAKSSSSESIDEEYEKTIQDSVNERTVFKGERNFQEADNIRDDLLERFDVVINDKLKEWSIGGNFGVFNSRSEYALSDTSAPVNALDRQYIEKALRERTQCKKRRNFDAADAIREKLKDNYNVFIDDREKFWRVNRDDFNSARNDDNRHDGNDANDAEEDVGNDNDEEDDIVAQENYEYEKEELSEETSSSLSPEFLSTLTVVQLKDKLRENGLTVSGRKAELVERLISNA